MRSRRRVLGMTWTGKTSKEPSCHRVRYRNQSDLRSASAGRPWVQVREPDGGCRPSRRSRTTPCPSARPRPHTHTGPPARRTQQPAQRSDPPHPTPHRPPTHISTTGTRATYGGKSESRSPLTKANDLRLCRDVTVSNVCPRRCPVGGRVVGSHRSSAKSESQSSAIVAGGIDARQRNRGAFERHKQKNGASSRIRRCSTATHTAGVRSTRPRSCPTSPGRRSSARLPADPGSFPDPVGEVEGPTETQIRVFRHGACGTSTITVWRITRESSGTAALPRLYSAPERAECVATARLFETIGGWRSGVGAELAAHSGKPTGCERASSTPPGRAWRTGTAPRLDARAVVWLPRLYRTLQSTPRRSKGVPARGT